MQEQANVSLSERELQLVCDPGWILTKNAILSKVITLFGQTAVGYSEQLKQSRLPEALREQSPKISRGEQYNGLPYAMLDLPRSFGREDVFAIRSFFWWGHVFSVTLHLKGVYREQYAAAVERAAAGGRLEGAWVNLGTAEWVHHADEGSWARLEPGWKPAAGNPLLKLQYQLPLTCWEQAAWFLQESFGKFLGVVDV
ncbi:MAG TPA: hypothetical protein PKE63_03435 [Lacibacter sp.]|nr:hypothetical protein [Lacibacter sp.]HMO88869.1 hypothetical protein [Lacibacter sp.]HMP86301.1 hypothetical protein [Lacibacter sp.]